MLTGSWGLARSPLVALGRSTRARTYASVNASLSHTTQLRHVHGPMSTEKLDEDRSLSLAAAKEDTQVEVFEDYADEYEAVASMSKPPRPSILEVIDSTLPAKLPLPSMDDTSIFEDESSEYNSTSLSSSSTHSLNDALLALLTEEKYDEAYKILVEMKQLDHEIHDHEVFEAAALSTLDEMLRSNTGSMTVPEHVARFEAFFSLVPSSRVDGKRTFTGIRKRILDNPVVNMDLVIRFSSILVMKGYVNLVQKYTIPFITRFASADICLQFVDDAIVGNKEFWLSKWPQKNGNAIVQSWNLRSTTIYWLIFSNRIEEALSLLPRDGSPMDGFRLSKRTHALLRFRLERSSKPEHRELTGYVDSLVLESPASRRTEGVIDPVAATAGSKAQIVMDRMASSPMTPSVGAPSRYEDWEDGDIVFSHSQPLPSSQPPNNLATALRRLKKAYTTPPSTDSLFANAPPLKEALSFFASYQVHARDKKGRAIALLRKRVLRVGRGPASHFLFAEMVHYRHAGQPELILETFMDHFYISAVPMDDVLLYYHEFCRNRDAELKAAKTGDIHLSFRIGMRDIDLSLFRTRLWPTTGHTSLVWHALVSLTKDDRAFLQLYQKLLQISTEGYAPLFTDSQSGESFSSPLVPPSTWDTNVPAAAFTPFIRRMLSASTTTAGSLGASLLGDMVRAGIEPNTHHLTEIAQFYAHQRDSRRAFVIMEQMEAAEKDQRFSSRNTGSTATTRSFPAPDVAFYCALLRAFIQTHNLDDSEKVASRITSRYIGEFESNTLPSEQRQVVDELLRDLAQLREAQKGEVKTAIN